MTDPKALIAERGAFEKWAVREGYRNLTREGDFDNEFGLEPVYCEPAIHAAWHAWRERATREQTASTGAPVGWFYELNREDNPKAGPVYLGTSDQKTAEIVAADENARVFPLYAAPVEQAGSPEAKHDE